MKKNIARLLVLVFVCTFAITSLTAFGEDVVDTAGVETAPEVTEEAVEETAPEATEGVVEEVAPEADAEAIEDAVVEPAPEIAAPAFTDVKDEDYFAVPVKWAVEKAITNGTSAETFSPEDTCTRAQILTFFWRAAGSPEPTVITAYDDVKEGDYFYKPAMWAKEKGIYVPEGSVFEPETPCTRGSTVEYFWRFSSCEEKERIPFSDIEAGSDLDKAVSWAVEKGITNGTGGTTFSPENICTRAQIVTFLHRYYVAALDNSELIAELKKTTEEAAPEEEVVEEKEEEATEEEEKTEEKTEETTAPEEELVLDPLPPATAEEIVDWAATLTPVSEMSDERVVAEYRQIQHVIAELTSQEIEVDEAIYTRESSLWNEGMSRSLDL